MLSEKEIRWLRGVGGALLWVGKEGRLDIAGACAMAMSWSPPGPTVEHILLANKTVKEIKATAEVEFRILPLDPHEAICMSVADASMANVENKSQGGFVLALAHRDIKTGKAAAFSISSWRSHRLKRVVKATLGSEALAMDDALAELEWIRALWCEILDPASCILDGTRSGTTSRCLRWGQTDDSESIHVTDAKALFDLLQRRSGNAGHAGEPRLM